MHTCISSHGLKRSWRSCPRWVNAGNKNTPSTHHPRRQNVTTLMVGLKNGHIRKNLTPPPPPPPPQKMVNPRDIAGERRRRRRHAKQVCIRVEKKDKETLQPLPFCLLAAFMGSPARIQNSAHRGIVQQYLWGLHLQRVDHVCTCSKTVTYCLLPWLNGEAAEYIPLVLVYLTAVLYSRWNSYPWVHWPPRGRGLPSPQPQGLPVGPPALQHWVQWRTCKYTALQHGGHWEHVCTLHNVHCGEEGWRGGEWGTCSPTATRSTCGPTCTSTWSSMENM